MLTIVVLFIILSCISGSSEIQLESGRISLERYVMGRIYTHAMFPNGDGDIMRDQ